jgi:hypothetical protein
MSPTCTAAIRSLRATQELHRAAARRAKQTRRPFSRTWHVAAALEIRADIHALATTARP